MPIIYLPRSCQFFGVPSTSQKQEGSVVVNKSMYTASRQPSRNPGHTSHPQPITCPRPPLAPPLPNQLVGLQSTTNGYGNQQQAHQTYGYSHNHQQPLHLLQQQQQQQQHQTAQQLPLQQNVTHGQPQQPIRVTQGGGVLGVPRLPPLTTDFQSRCSGFQRLAAAVQSIASSMPADHPVPPPRGISPPGSATSTKLTPTPTPTPTSTLTPHHVNSGHHSGNDGALPPNGNGHMPHAHGTPQDTPSLSRVPPPSPPVTSQVASAAPASGLYRKPTTGQSNGSHHGRNGSGPASIPQMPKVTATSATNQHPGHTHGSSTHATPRENATHQQGKEVVSNYTDGQSMSDGAAATGSVPLPAPNQHIDHDVHHMPDQSNRPMPTKNDAMSDTLSLSMGGALGGPFGFHLPSLLPTLAPQGSTSTDSASLQQMQAYVIQQQQAKINVLESMLYTLLQSQGRGGVVMGSGPSLLSADGSNHLQPQPSCHPTTSRLVQAPSETTSFTKSDTTPSSPSLPPNTPKRAGPVALTSGHMSMTSPAAAPKASNGHSAHCPPGSTLHSVASPLPNGIGLNKEPTRGQHAAVTANGQGCRFVGPASADTLPSLPNRQHQSAPMPDRGQRVSTPHVAPKTSIPHEPSKRGEMQYQNQDQSSIARQRHGTLLDLTEEDMKRLEEMTQKAKTDGSATFQSTPAPQNLMSSKTHQCRQQGLAPPTFLVKRAQTQASDGKPQRSPPLPQPSPPPIPNPHPSVSSIHGQQPASIKPIGPHIPQNNSGTTPAPRREQTTPIVTDRHHDLDDALLVETPRHSSPGIPTPAITPVLASHLPVLHDSSPAPPKPASQRQRRAPRTKPTLQLVHGGSSITSLREVGSHTHITTQAMEPQAQTCRPASPQAASTNRGHPSLDLRVEPVCKLSAGGSETCEEAIFQAAEAPSLDTHKQNQEDMKEALLRPRLTPHQDSSSLTSTASSYSHPQLAPSTKSPARALASSATHEGSTAREPAAGEPAASTATNRAKLKTNQQGQQGKRKRKLSLMLSESIGSQLSGETTEVGLIEMVEETMSVELTTAACTPMDKVEQDRGHKPKGESLHSQQVDVTITEEPPKKRRRQSHGTNVPIETVETVEIVEAAELVGRSPRGPGRCKSGEERSPDVPVAPPPHPPHLPPLAPTPPTLTRRGRGNGKRAKRGTSDNQQVQHSQSTPHQDIQPPSPQAQPIPLSLPEPATVDTQEEIQRPCSQKGKSAKVAGVKEQVSTSRTPTKEEHPRGRGSQSSCARKSSIAGTEEGVKEKARLKRKCHSPEPIRKGSWLSMTQSSGFASTDDPFES